MAALYLSLKDLKEEIKLATLDDLYYMNARYCGPHNVLLRKKKYQYEACKEITRIIGEEISYRVMESILLSDD